VTAFLALILLLAGVETLDVLRGSPLHYLAMIGGPALAGVLMWVAWQRVTLLLARADLFAQAAACPRCQAWGKFDVVAREASTAEDPPESGRRHWLSVRCRKCWQLG